MKLNNKEIIMCKIAESIGTFQGIKNSFKEYFGEESNASCDFIDKQINNLEEALEYIKKDNI